MKHLFESRIGLLLALLADVLLYAGSPGTGTHDYTASSFEVALAAQERVTEEWLALEGVVGTAIGVDGSGHAVLKVYLTDAGVATLPRFVGVDVVPEVTGQFAALSAPSESKSAVDPTTSFPRPVPIGVSAGHPQVSAGTIGARVTDGSRTFGLSNNHIFAANNGGQEGDNLLQPGVADGGKNPDDAFGTLFDYEPLRFCRWAACEPNRIDAALALTSPQDLNTATPEGGYGHPRPWSVEASLGMRVQKFGRTTGLTLGEVSGIHATIDVRYRTGTARFEDQIVISGAGFSAGGDSGSLVVSKGLLLGDRRPVGLLFAGTSSATVANPIDLVLERFGVRIEGG